MATNPRMLAATKKWKKRQGKDCLLDLPEGARLCQHLDSGPVVLFLYFWLPELWKNKFQLFVIICYSIPRK